MWHPPTNGDIFVVNDGLTQNTRLCKYPIHGWKLASAPYICMEIGDREGIHELNISWAVSPTTSMCASRNKKRICDA